MMFSGGIHNPCNEVAAAICAGHGQGAPPPFHAVFARALWKNSEAAKHFNTRHPIRQSGELDEIAGAPVFLTGSAGQYVNEQIIVVEVGLI